MIEQTEMMVTEWHYHAPVQQIPEHEIKCLTSLDVMQKRASTKKGLAVRLTSHFVHEKEIILAYIGEHSYVIDFEEVIDKQELISMFRNSFAMFKEKFELRKLQTILLNGTISPLNESLIDYDAILPLLV